MLKSYFIFFQLLMKGKSCFRFAFGVVIGLAFSIAVILCTVGIMDGFDLALKNGLKNSNGDLIITAKDNFFHLDKNITNAFEDLGVTEYTAIIQKEAFLVYNSSSKGVLVKGIDKSVDNSLNYSLSNKEVMIGEELFKILNLNIGDEILLVFASGPGEGSSGNTPSLYTFKVKGVIKHGIYIKDLRFVYVNKSVLQQIFNLKDDEVNILSLNIPSSVIHTKKQTEQSLTEHMALVEEYQQRLQLLLNQASISNNNNSNYNNNTPHLRVSPFWKEFQYLIEAVRVEKFIISFILQLIVIISVFNVMAFIIYLNEKQAQEIFLLQALGMSKKKLTRIWITLVFIIWPTSSLLAIIFTNFFDFALRNLKVLKMPGEIYNLTQLSLEISLSNYCMVFSLALLWILLIVLIGLKKIRKESILKGLRKGFS
ncbi:MAG: ABC transporter permease [Oligoflexia bacterium]|nr:ABC transporter permease [Oligoflexia bacterium]